MPRNPILDRLSKDSKRSPAHRASAGLERKLAIQVGGYTTSGSGNKNEKGDVRILGVARLEHKATQAKSFRVTLDMLEKIEHAARGCDEVPVIVVEFVDTRGTSVQSPLAVIPLHDLMDIIHAQETTVRDNS